MDLTNLYFPVEKIPAEELMPGYEFPSGISHAVVVTKPDGVKRVVNYCSDIYSLVENQTVIPRFYDEIKKYFPVEVHYKMQDYSRFFIDFVINNKALKVNKKDVVFPKVRLVNSYDGKVKYHFTIGFFRLVCTNGLTIPVGYAEKIKKLHTPSIQALVSFERVMEMTSKFIAEASEIFNVYMELTDQTVRNPELRITDVIENTNFPPSLAEDVLERLEIERNLLNAPEVNDWLIYNAFNYQLNHNDIKTKEVKREEIDQEVFKYLLEY